MFAEYRREMEKLNEKMRETFLSKYGKQGEENQLELQALKLKVERGLLDELDFKRLVKEAEKRVVTQIEAFEDEQTALRSKRDDADDKRDQDNRRAAHANEERFKHYDRMFEAWETEKTKLHTERQQLNEELVAERAQRKNDLAEEKREQELREEKLNAKLQASDTSLKDEIRLTEKRFRDRLEHLEWEWREKEKNWKIQHHQSTLEVGFGCRCCSSAGCCCSLLILYV